MSPEEFAAAKAILGFGTTRLAALLCTTERSIQRWQTGTDPVPPLVAKIMRAIIAGRINPQDLEDCK